MQFFFSGNLKSGTKCVYINCLVLLHDLHCVVGCCPKRLPLVDPPNKLPPVFVAVLPNSPVVPELCGWLNELPNAVWVLLPNRLEPRAGHQDGQEVNIINIFTTAFSNMQIKL